MSSVGTGWVTGGVVVVGGVVVGVGGVVVGVGGVVVGVGGVVVGVGGVVVGVVVVPEPVPVPPLEVGGGGCFFPPVVGWWVGRLTGLVEAPPEPWEGAKDCAGRVAVTGAREGAELAER